MNNVVKLDVSFRGNRPYIQGSMICSQVAGKIGHLAPDFENPVLRSCKFKKLPETSLFACRNFPDDVSKIINENDKIGELDFLGSDGNKLNIWLIEDPEKALPTRVVDTPSTIQNINLSAPFSGSAEVAINSSFDSHITSLVEVTKKLNQLTVEHATHIWFIGLGKSELKVPDQKNHTAPTPLEGIIDLKNLSVRNHEGPEFITSSKFNLRIPQLNESSTGLILFKYND